MEGMDQEVSSKFSQLRPGRSRGRGFTSSWLVHAVIIALGWAWFHSAPLTKIVTPGEKSGSVVTAIYSPANGYQAGSKALRAASAPASAPRPAPAAATSAAVLRAPGPVQPKGGDAQSISTTPDTVAATGMDSLGEGNVRIALGAFIPQPKPDLSVFPRGFEGDVVVDVLIDESGHIRQKKLLRGISPQVDNTVMAALETWQFTPAERNGVAISSEQELLFHYGPV